ncbi:MAG: hypothetical protein U0974_13285 [Gemmatimonadales bacterium]|nr:hypothetical protein [Gemmatimonadales bacterium]MDZ4390693.1 hypothetical protein [Gemmatimonadales bacterium]
MAVGLAVLLFWPTNAVRAQSGESVRFQQLDGQAAVTDQLARACAWVGTAGISTHNDLVARRNSARANASQELLRLLCVRSRLMIARVPTTIATGMRLGESWAGAIVRDVLPLVYRSPLDERALTILAATVLLHMPGQRFAAPEAPGMTAYSATEVGLGVGLPELASAVRAGLTSPFLLRACASLAINLGDFPTARDCAIRGLEHGNDSTWHLLRLSAMAAWRLDTLEATMAFRRAVTSVGTSRAAREELGWHLEAGFRHKHECQPCEIQGIFNMGWAPANPLLHEGRWPVEQRHLFDSLPSAELLPWIEREIAMTREDSAPSWLRTSPLIWQPSIRYEQIWRQGGELTRRVFKHFHLTSYRNGTFRSCWRYIDHPRPPCTPRRLPLVDTYLTTSMAVASIWDPESGQPLSLLTWALAAEELGREGGDPNRVTLEWRRWGITTGTQWDSTAVLPVPSGPATKGWLVGVTPIPAGPAPTVSLMLIQGAARRGGVFVDHLRPLQAGPLAISDPLLGQEGTGGIWHAGADSVPVSPFRVFARQEVVTVAYQVRSDRHLANGRLRIRIFGEEGDSGDPSHERIAITVPVEVQAGLHLYAKEFEMPDLDAGGYRFEITLLDGNAAVTSPRRVSFVMR